MPKIVHCLMDYKMKNSSPFTHLPSRSRAKLSGSCTHRKVDYLGVQENPYGEDIVPGNCRKCGSTVEIKKERWGGVDSAM